MNTILEQFVPNFKLTNDLKYDIQKFFTIHNDKETLEHTLKVAAEARRVAQLYNVDPLKAEQVGLLHDISNVIPVKEMLHVAEVLSIEILPEERTYARIVHQKLSKAMAFEIFKIDDQEMLSAMECHTTMKPHSSLLDKVLFISDKISWEVPGDHQYLKDIRTKVDEHKITEGILIYLNNIWEQRDKLKLVHPWLIKAREELLKQF